MAYLNVSIGVVFDYSFFYSKRNAYFSRDHAPPQRLRFSRRLRWSKIVFGARYVRSLTLSPVQKRPAGKGTVFNWLHMEKTRRTRVSQDFRHDGETYEGHVKRFATFFL